ncbi:hypothetical protein UlMin_001543 [Ulmus minor]
MGNIKFLLKSQIEALLSVSPANFTDPRQVRQVLAKEQDLLGVFGGCLNVLLYYKKACQEDSGSIHAGWIKETLGMALLEQPLLCGRLRPKESGEKEVEIVSNDSGVRLVEARIPATLSEFLGSKSTREDFESELVFWKDIDRDDPKFSPLFYVQVTKFDCGGYSFGISCTLLLADLLFKENFLKRWAKIHNNMILSSQNNALLKEPIFYLPNLKHDGPSSTTNILSPSPNQNSGETMIFNISPADPNQFCLLASLCIEETEKKLMIHGEKGSEFSLIVKEGHNNDVIKIERCSKDEQVKPKPRINSLISSSSWDDFGGYEVEFREGNKPLHVSCWIKSISSGGLVMGIPSSSDDKDKYEAKIIVAVSN